MFQPTAINVTTLLMVAITVWLIYNRQRGRLDSNWPLFYYIALVFYSKSFQDALHPNMVFIGVVWRRTVTIRTSRRRSRPSSVPW
jgi:hypothetical protein